MFSKIIFHLEPVFENAFLQQILETMNRTAKCKEMREGDVHVTNKDPGLVHHKQLCIQSKTPPFCISDLRDDKIYCKVQGTEEQIQSHVSWR